MNVGGVEKALLGLLTKIPLDQYEVHVGLLNREGGFLDLLPEEVTVHEIDCYKKYWSLLNERPWQRIRQLLRKGQFNKAFIRFFWYGVLYVHYKLSLNQYHLYKYLLRKEKIFPIDFDLAVSFAGPSQMVDYYVCEKVRAAKKCGWIHFDVSKFGMDRGMICLLYKQYEKIFIVSDQGKVIFDRIFPQFSNKTEVFHNIVSKEQVCKMAKKGPTFDDGFDGIRILTVGRISKEKGQKVAIEAFKSLLDRGYHMKWYFVGDGADRDCCEQLVEDCGIKGNVVFLGTQINPYGFMKDCDLYVQPSRHEGFCITLAEALCFNMPIVATNFTGANEQLQARKNGIVVGMSAEEIAKGVIDGLKLSSCDSLVSLSNNISKLFDVIQ